MSKPRAWRIIARTARAFAPNCEKSWLRVTLPSGESVRVEVVITRGQRNSVAVLAVEAPAGSSIIAGEKLVKVIKGGAG